MGDLPDLRAPTVAPNVASYLICPGFWNGGDA